MHLMLLHGKDVLEEATGTLMLAAGFALAYMQDATVSANENLVNSIVQALTFGGGLAVAGAFILKRIDKQLDARQAREHAREVARTAENEARRAEDKEERAQARADIERMFALQDRHIDRMFQMYDVERQRVDQLVQIQRIGTQTVETQVVQQS